MIGSHANLVMTYALHKNWTNHTVNRNKPIRNEYIYPCDRAGLRRTWRTDHTGGIGRLSATQATKMKALQEYSIQRHTKQNTNCTKIEN